MLIYNILYISISRDTQFYGQLKTIDVYKRQVINNGRRGEELEKAQEYAERTTPEKPSIRERLEDAKRECAEHKPPEGKKPGRDVPEYDCL